mgnify:CR=1 FL=1
MLNCCISVRSLKPFARDPEVTQYFISALVASFCGTLKTKAFILLSPLAVGLQSFLYIIYLVEQLFELRRKCIRIH